MYSGEPCTTATKVASTVPPFPFFVKYPLHGIKVLDFQDFAKAGDIIKGKEHLTKEGLAKIEEIKSRMNTKRIC